MRVLKPRRRLLPRRALPIRPPRPVPRKRARVMPRQMLKRRKAKRSRRQTRLRPKKRRKAPRKRKRRKVPPRSQVGIKEETKKPQTSSPLNSLVWLRNQTGWHSEWPDNRNKFDQA